MSAIPLTSILIILGAISLLSLLNRAARFIHIHFLRRGNLTKYLAVPAGRKPYALVTGASDGIGLATARQLHARGFHILLHGRNPAKLASKAESLRSVHPEREVRTVVANAADPVPAVKAVCEAVAEIERDGGVLKVLVNNVGGSNMFGARSFQSVLEISEDVADKQISLNARFPTLLTIALVRGMVKEGHKPGLVLNVGSYAGLHGVPFVQVYAGCKALNHIWSSAVTAELRALGIDKDLEFLAVPVGEVETGGNKWVKGGKKFAQLTSEQLAKEMLQKVGCGRRMVSASWQQALLNATLELVPAGLDDWIVVGELGRRMLKYREWEIRDTKEK